MKTIELKRLTLRNFKGQRNFEAEFSHNTQINGDNGTGKTTVFDAYTWLLYGKNSHNQTDFSIKTLDNNNQPIEKLEHEVEGVFDVDSKKVTFKRCYAEIWRTQKGSEFETMTGHETKFFIDDVPKSKSEYEIKVREMIEESISKIISSPEYFNVSLGWKERRVILERMAGEVSDGKVLDAIATPQNDMGDLISLLNKGAKLEDEKAKYAAQKKKLKDELKLIPSRIDEVDRGKPEALDFAALEDKLKQINKSIEVIDAQILDKNKAVEDQREAAAKVKTEKFDKEQEFQKLKDAQTVSASDNSETISKLTAERATLTEAKNKKGVKESAISSNELTIERLNGERDTLLAEYKKLTALTFVVDEADQCCPTCKRAMDNADETIKQAQANFNTSKANKLKINEGSGKSTAEQIKTLTEQNETLAVELKPVQTIIDTQLDLIAQLEAKLNAPKVDPEPTPEMIALQKEYASLVVPEITLPNTEELSTNKRTLEVDRDEIKGQLSRKETIVLADQRIEELKGQQKTLSQDIADLEKVEFQIDAFNKSKAMLIESRVNEKFALVKFKMFKEQINGGEEPTCICMVDGVPYNDLNTANQINASLDIINALQYHYQIFAPVFIDHRESVVQLHPMECQTVGLFVDETAKELQILNLG